MFLRTYGVPAVFLAIWLALHVFGAVTGQQRWWIAFGLIVAAPIYVGLVHRLDRWLALGGLGHHVSRKKLADPDKSLSANERPALANQTVMLTTGFAAILLFSTVRLYTDLRLSQRLDTRFTWVLVAAAMAFCTTCVLNLLQLRVLGLLDQRDMDAVLKRRLRRILRKLHRLGWHVLMTPVILLLLLIESAWPALLVNAFYGTGLFVYYFSTLGWTAPAPPGPKEKFE